MRYYFPSAFSVIFLSFFLSAQSVQLLGSDISASGVSLKVDRQNELLQHSVSQHFFFDGKRGHGLFSLSTAFLVESYGSYNENLLWDPFSQPMFAMQIKINSKIQIL